jgi:hypothetical protein
LRQAERERRVPARYHIALELAFAHTALRQFARASELVRPGLEYFERIGATGFALGRFEEARARIALASDDQPTFRSCIERCALEYRKTGNADLVARVSRLVDQADQQRLLESALVHELTSTPPQRQPTRTDTLHARLVECVDKPERASCALSWLLQSAEASRGHLFGVDGDGLTLLASLPDNALDPALKPWLKGWLDNGSSAETTQEILPIKPSDLNWGAESKTVTEESVERFIAADGCRYEAFMLTAELGSGQRRLAALLVLELDRTSHRSPPPLLLATIAHELLAQHDVTGASM